MIAMMKTRSMPALLLCFFITIFQKFTPTLAGSCEGSADSCSSVGWALCPSQLGCTPGYYDCVGTPRSCSGISDSFYCDQQHGCEWSFEDVDPSGNSSENSGMSAGAIAGIVIGLLVATGIFIFIYIKKPWKRSMDGSSSAVAPVHYEPRIKDVESSDSSCASEPSINDVEDQRDNLPYENTDYEEPEINYMEPKSAYDSTEKAPACGKNNKVKGKGKASAKAKAKGKESNNLDDGPEVSLPPPPPPPPPPLAGHARYGSPADMIKLKTAPPPELIRDYSAGLPQPKNLRPPSPKQGRSRPTGTKAHLHGSPASPDRVSDPIGMELYSYPQGNTRVRSHTTKTSPDGSRMEVIEYTDGSKVTKTFPVSS